MSVYYFAGLVGSLWGYYRFKSPSFKAGFAGLIFLFGVWTIDTMPVADKSYEPASIQVAPEPAPPIPHNADSETDDNG